MKNQNDLVIDDATTPEVFLKYKQKNCEHKGKITFTEDFKLKQKSNR